MFPFQCCISHHTLPFSFQLQEASRQATVVVESHCFPSQPDVYPCISIVRGWHTYARAHTHHRMVYIVFPISFMSLLAWSQPRWLPCVFASDCQQDGRLHRGDSLKKTLVTHTCVRTGTSADWFGGTSHQLDLKARITKQEAQKKTHCCHGRFIIPCFLAVSFSSGQFFFLVYLGLYPCSPAWPPWPPSAWDVLWIEIGGWNRTAVMQKLREHP